MVATTGTASASAMVVFRFGFCVLVVVGTLGCCDGQTVTRKSKKVHDVNKNALKFRVVGVMYRTVLTTKKPTDRRCICRPSTYTWQIFGGRQRS